jgi:hypothetical protein
MLRQTKWDVSPSGQSQDAELAASRDERTFSRCARKSPVAQGRVSGAGCCLDDAQECRGDADIPQLFCVLQLEATDVRKSCCRNRVA